MFKKFKDMHNILKFYLMFVVGLVFQCIESITSMANLGLLTSLILSVCSLVCFITAIVFAFRKDKKEWLP